jgi:ketosteroid isomerase-like protein
MRAGVLLLGLLGAALPAVAGDFEDMVAAERRFVADVSARGMRDGFLAALADDAVAFQPGPVEGQRVWSARKPNKNRLEWTPAMAEVAASGDLGYSVGPWRITPEGAAKPAAYGWFLTIWRKQADGHWKVLADHGIDSPEAAFPAAVQRRGAITLGAPPSWPVGIPELRSADLVPAGELNPRLVSADFLRLRAGRAPDGRAEGQPMPGRASRVDGGLVVSGAGDLAATWGGGPGSPSWLRVWRRPSAEDAAGAGWRLAVDLSVPVPPDPATETQH